MNRCFFLPLSAAALAAWLLGLVTPTDAAPIQGFSTGGHTVYHLQPATVDKSGRRVIISAAYDGVVLCHAYDGTLLWQAPTDGYFPFDLAVGDMDGDGLDEAVVASADGSLYALDHDGRCLWTFAKEPPLYQACLARGRDGRRVVLAGGVEKTLYALSPEGKVLARLAGDNVIRVIRAGNILGDGLDTAAVVSAHDGRSGFLLQLYDAATLKPLWPQALSLTDQEKGGDRVRVFGAALLDLNGDGKDEIVVSVSTGKNASLAAYDGRGKRLPMKPCQAGKARPYRMNLLAPVRLGPDVAPFLLGLFGTELIGYNLDGSRRALHEAPYAFANLAFDPVTKTCLLGSDISGGDGLYLMRLDEAGWGQAFEKVRPVGKLNTILKNLETLRRQTREFRPPAYQPEARPAVVYLQQKPAEIAALRAAHGPFQHVSFASYENFLEHYEPGITNPKWRAEWERRHSGKVTPRAEILEYARQREAAGEKFVIWAGHGRIFGIDFYISMETIEALLKTAPKTLEGFVFAELETVDEAMREAITRQLVPMAEMCRKYGGKKILLRNKNVFWSGSCYHPTWCDVLIGGKYRDIFVPSMEETNCRTQELSLMGREGLWLTGHFDHLSARMVTDNATYSRFWEWGQQQALSHFVRTLALQTTLGADILHINLYQAHYEDLAFFYEMLEKGIVPIPTRDNVLSVSDLCLTMGKPSEAYGSQARNGHSDSAYQPGEYDGAVFGRLACFWGGAPVEADDFTRYACGSRQRMLNFLPRNPYGLVAMIPDSTDLAAFPRWRQKQATDGECFYDAQGAKRTAKDYRPVMVKALEAAAARLPVLVQGDVSWTVVRLDPAHMRVLLIDPGYLDPADRNAEIMLQSLEGIECRDVLSGEALPVQAGRIRARVPMGIFRVLDVTHKPPAGSVP